MLGEIAGVEKRQSKSKKGRKLYDTRNGHEKSRTLFKVRLQLVGDTWFESIIKGKTG